LTVQVSWSPDGEYMVIGESNKILIYHTRNFDSHPFSMDIFGTVIHLNWLYSFDVLIVTKDEQYGITIFTAPISILNGVSFVGAYIYVIIDD
jgi:hypothetical protein